MYRMTMSFVLLCIAWAAVRSELAQSYISGVFENASISPSASDSTFIGDRKTLIAIRSQLDGVTAWPAEVAADNDTLNVAVIDSLPDAPQTPPGKKRAPPRIAVNLAAAGRGAVLVVAPGPAKYIIENGGAQKGKIAIEGHGAFELEGAATGVLAGYRSHSFGRGDSAAAPEDYISPKGYKGVFCGALDYWAKLYRVRTTAVRIYIFSKPTRIDVFPNALSGSPNPQTSSTWTAAVTCDDSFQFARSRQIHYFPNDR